MRELIHELVDAMNKQLEKRFGTTVRNVNIEDRSRLMPFNVLGRYNHAEQVEAEKCLVLQLELRSWSKSGHVYGDEECLPDLDESTDDPVAKMLRPYLQTVTVERDAASMCVSKTFLIEMHLADDSEQLIRNMISFFKDPEWFEYSEKFDEEMSDLLSRNEV